MQGRGARKPTRFQNGEMEFDIQRDTTSNGQKNVYEMYCALKITVQYLIVYTILHKVSNVTLFDTLYTILFCTYVCRRGTYTV